MELISREEAKRKIIEELDSIDHVPGWVFRRLERVISSLPAIDEQKEGTWIIGYGGNGWNDWYIYECPICGAIIEDRYDRKNIYNFCPNCGTRMKGE